jgi:type IV pilus modification protein PilV
VESLVALLLLSLGLLGAGVMLLEALRSHADALRERTATQLVRDMAERIRANPRARRHYDTRAIAGDRNCAEVCSPAQRAAHDLAHFAAAVGAAFPGAATRAHIEFEPAIGPAAPETHAISLQWRGPRDTDQAHNEVTHILLAQPVAGGA